MTPVLSATTNADKHYNKMHAKTRSKVERCIGVLKNRFRCLLGERKLLYSHEKASKIIVSCVVLHNFMNSRGEFGECDNINEGNVDNDHLQSQSVDQQNYVHEGRRIRDELIATLYANNQE